MFFSVIEAVYLTNYAKLYFTVKLFVREQERSLFEEHMTPRLVLSVEMVGYMYWKGRLIVVSLFEAGYCTNCPPFFILLKNSAKYCFSEEPMIIWAVLRCEPVPLIYWQRRSIASTVLGDYVS
jgi:hypothetical protein